MLLVIDVGNTNTVLGVYDGSQLRQDWRIRTERNTTEDEFNILINSLFAAGNIPVSHVGSNHHIMCCPTDGHHFGRLLPQVFGASASMGRCQKLCRDAHFVKKSGGSRCRSHRQCRRRV